MERAALVGVLGIVYYQVKSNGTEAASEPKLWMLYTFSLAVSSVGSCTDFFIYFVRIPAFRAFLLCRSPTAAAFKEIEL